MLTKWFKSIIIHGFGVIQNMGPLVNGKRRDWILVFNSLYYPQINVEEI